jgi:hypothetical protein
MFFFNMFNRMIEIKIIFLFLKFVFKLLISKYYKQTIIFNRIKIKSYFKTYIDDYKYLAEKIKPNNVEHVYE